jgi:hypothetical protein
MAAYEVLKQAIKYVQLNSVTLKTDRFFFDKEAFVYEEYPAELKIEKRYRIW